MLHRLAGETGDLVGRCSDVMEYFVPRKDRTALWRTWGSLMGMLPVGGPDLWGNHTWSPEDTEEMIGNRTSYG